MKFEEMKALAMDNGFSAVGRLNRSALIFMPEIRDMCSADKCHTYGKSWRCPPAIGTVEDSFKLTEDYKDGIILQTIGKMEDDFDYETISATASAHAGSFIAMMRQLKAQTKDVLGMGAGTCKKCDKCTYPDAPCRFPEDSYPSMEAYGLWVSDVCSKSGIPYYNGKGTITYVSCILFKDMLE